MNGFKARRSIGIAAVAFAVVVGAGCGTPEKQATIDVVSPRKAVLASVRTTAAAESARMSMSVNMGGGDKSLAITADGVTDFTTGDGELKMNLSGLGSEFLSGGFEMRVVDGTIYMKMPAALGGMFGADKWLKMPSFGSADQTVPGLGQTDPTQFLAYLETVSSDVEKVGTDDIRGVETTHYHATLDLGQAAARVDVPPSLREKLDEALAKVKGLGPIPADVWVDSNGLARRIKLAMDLGSLASGVTGADALPTVSITMDLYDFGVPVHVVAPPPEDVTSLPGIFGPSGPSGRTA